MEIEEGKEFSKMNTITPDDENDDNLFEGELEEFREKAYYGDPNYQIDTTLVTPQVKSNRELYKMVLIRQRKDFEAPVTLSDKIASDESSGNVYEVKQLPTKDFLMAEKVVLEMGFQTANSSIEKSYQVHKVKVKNTFSQVEENMNDIKPRFESKQATYLNNSSKLKDIENFLQTVKNQMEQALQSNETIDIFQNDFDLDKKAIIAEVKDKENDSHEVRTFRESSIAGQKTKKLKCVNFIRMVKSDEVYFAHTLMRNLGFDERIRLNGIPVGTHILFWNFKDPEISSHIWQIDLPMEITCFEFNPDNCNQIVCGLISGQLLIQEYNDLLLNLKRSETENKKSKNYLK